MRERWPPQGLPRGRELLDYILAPSNSSSLARADAILPGAADEVLINQVIQDLIADGRGALGLSSGQINLADMILPEDNLILEGAGAATAITTAVADLELIRLWEKDNTKIRDILFDGGGVADIAIRLDGTAVTGVRCFHNTVKGCFFRDFDVAGIFSGDPLATGQGTLDLKIFDNYFYDCGYGYGSHEAYSSKVSLNHFEDCGSGIRMKGHESVMSLNTFKTNTYGIESMDYGSSIIGNAFTGHTYAIYLFGGRRQNVIGNNFILGVTPICVTASGNTITGNVIDRCSGSAIIITGGDFNILQSNIVRTPDTNDSGDPGILIEAGADFTQIKDNFVDDAFQDALELNDVENCQVKGNELVNNGRYGILLDNAALQNKIKNNETAGNTTACMRINNVNCVRNLITGNSFDEGNISDVGGAHNCVAYLNYDPSAGTFIVTINPPAVVGGGGGVFP